MKGMSKKMKSEAIEILKKYNQTQILNYLNLCNEKEKENYVLKSIN